MGGRQKALIVAATIALLSSTRALAGGPPWKPDFVRQIVQRSDLVVRGTIDSVGTGTAPEPELKSRKSEFPATVIHLHVSSVIKGSWSTQTIDAVLLGTAQAGTEGVSYDYKPGEELILCLRYDPEAHGGMYRFWNGEQCFVDHAGTWETHGPFPHEVSLDAVIKAARQTDPQAMALDADAIAIGTVRSFHLRTFYPDGTSVPGDIAPRQAATADYASVLVTGQLKGEASAGDTLLVRVIRRGSNIEWYEPVPALEVGRSYVMFLKKDSVGYYPFRGFNGFLEVSRRSPDAQ